MRHGTRGLETARVERVVVKFSAMNFCACWGCGGGHGPFRCPNEGARGAFRRAGRRGPAYLVCERCYERIARAKAESRAKGGAR